MYLQFIIFVKINFINCFSIVKFPSVGFFFKCQTQPKNIIKNPKTKIKRLELLYFVFYISVVFFKSLFQSILTLLTNLFFANIIVYIKFFQKVFFYSFNTIMKLFSTVVYIRIISLRWKFDDHPLVEYPLFQSLLCIVLLSIF